MVERLKNNGAIVFVPKYFVRGPIFLADAVGVPSLPPRFFGWTVPPPSAVGSTEAALGSEDADEGSWHGHVHDDAVTKFRLACAAEGAACMPLPRARLSLSVGPSGARVIVLYYVLGVM